MRALFNLFPRPGAIALAALLTAYASQIVWEVWVRPATEALDALQPELLALATRERATADLTDRVGMMRAQAARRHDLVRTLLSRFPPADGGIWPVRAFIERSHAAVLDRRTVPRLTVTEFVYVPARQSTHDLQEVLDSFQDMGARRVLPADRAKVGPGVRVRRSTVTYGVILTYDQLMELFLALENFALRSDIVDLELWPLRDRQGQFRSHPRLKGSLRLAVHSLDPPVRPPPGDS